MLFLFHGNFIVVLVEVNVTKLLILNLTLKFLLCLKTIGCLFYNKINSVIDDLHESARAGVTRACLACCI